MSQTLVIDATGTPVGFVPWQRAVRLHFAHRASILASDDEALLRSPGFTMGMPRVIQLQNRVSKGLRRRVPLSRRSLAIRDESTCQYCGQRLTTQQFTLDHVLPRSQGGVSSWLNLVIACVRCNKHKGGRRPEQARMKLLKPPVEPSVWDKRFDFRLHINKLRPEWQPWSAWLYWNVVLEQ